MDNRLALIGVVINDKEQAVKVNELLHNVSQFVVGRMGIPYKDKGLSIISIVIDAPQNIISSLGGKLGALAGVQAKTIYTQAEAING